MKMSLKEWFLNEDIENDVQKSSSTKSSTNVSICVEDDQCPKGEDALAEYENPTSNSHDSDDDSKWAGPMSSHEGMPHEKPHNLAQQRSADGWKESHKNVDSHYPGSHKSTLKSFFGDEPYPKVDEDHDESDIDADVWCDARKDQRAEGGDEQPWPISPEEDDVDEAKRPDWMDQPMSMGKKGAGPAAPKSSQMSAPAEPKKSSQMAVPWRAAQRAAEEPKIDQDAPDFSGLDDPDFLSKMGIDPDDSKHSKKAGGPKMKDVIKTSEPEEPEPDASEFYDQPQSRKSRLLSPKLKPGAEVDDEYGKIMAGEPLGAETAEEGEMTWDELRATDPEAAQELEREVPEEERDGAQFKKKADGRIYMDSPKGRKSYLGPDVGWTEMDDGESPAGEF